MENKKAKVIMLPTNDKTGTIWENTDGNLIYTHVSGEYKEKYKPYHLYITSDDKIKEGDWFIDLETNNIHKSHGNMNGLILIKDNSPMGCNPSFCEKIIATTNNSLISQIGIGEMRILDDACQPFPKTKPKSWNLPQPSQAFIKEFVGEYNKGNIITDVLVEYEKLYGTVTRGGDVNYAGKTSISDSNNHIAKEYGYWESHDYHPVEYNKLKVNPKDNTINIKQEKDSWNREEVEEKLKEYRQFAWQNGLTILDLTNWIEKNL